MQSLRRRSLLDEFPPQLCRKCREMGGGGRIARSRMRLEGELAGMRLYTGCSVRRRKQVRAAFWWANGAVRLRLDIIECHKTGFWCPCWVWYLHVGQMRSFHLELCEKIVSVACLMKKETNGTGGVLNSQKTPNGAEIRHYKFVMQLLF